MLTCLTGVTGSDVRIYFDSSALIKRSVEETESDALDAAIDHHIEASDVLLSSSLAWVEVSRALRTLAKDHRTDIVDDAISTALSGIAERLITADVIGLARRMAPPRLRTLDAIHLATAIALDVDLVIAYDDRLLDACRHHHLATVAPGR